MTDELRECYRILEVDPSASPEAVKNAYRELLKVWHPDRFPNDPSFQGRANEKTKQLNQAYQTISAYLASNQSGSCPDADSSEADEDSELKKEAERARAWEEAQFREEAERARAWEKAQSRDEEWRRNEEEGRRQAAAESRARRGKSPRLAIVLLVAIASILAISTLMYWSATQSRATSDNPSTAKTTSAPSVAEAHRQNASQGFTREGQKRWEFQTPAVVNSCPAIGADGTVYVGSSVKLIALNPATGTPRWEFTADGQVNSPAIGGDGTVYVGSSDNCIYALDGRTGAKRWTLRREAQFCSRLQLARKV